MVAQEPGKESREAIRNKMKSDIEKEKVKKETEVASLSEEEHEYARQVDKKRQEFERLSTTSVDLEMLRTQIDQVESVLKGIADERERLRVEVNAPPRITLLEHADLPEGPADSGIRIFVMLVAAFMSFCLPLASVVSVRLGRRFVRSVERL